MTRMMMSFLLCLVGAAIFAIPNMTRRSVLFGVAVRPDFRASIAGRRRVTEFRSIVAATILAAIIAVFLSPAASLEWVAATGPLAIVIAGALAFLRGHAKVARFADQALRSRDAQVATAPENLPWFVWLSPGPFLILGAAARFLYLNWERIPARFPVHWGIDGRPDSWSARTAQGVYGPIILGAEFCAWLLIIALAGWFGARRSRFRRMMLAVLIAFGYMLALLFSAFPVTPVLHLPVWLPIVLVIAFAAPCIVALVNALAEPRDSLEPTPNECWKAGVIYYNPSDPALFVEKRAGLGYTLNLANRWSWVLVLGTLFVIVSVPVLM